MIASYDMFFAQGDDFWRLRWLQVH